MPPAKTRPIAAQEDSRSDGSTARERQIAAAAHARKSKILAGTTAVSARDSGSGLKELALVSTAAGDVVSPGQNPGMQWSSAPLDLLNAYRVANNIPSPPAFTSPLNQALLTNPGIGRQSPTMARTKDKRRVSKEQLATAVRKHFNGAAVSEIDVVVEMVYKVRNQGKAFRMRSAAAGVKKA